MAKTAPSTMTEAAAMLGRLLDAVDRGELEAIGGRGALLVRHVEGAIVGLRVAAGENLSTEA